MAAILASYIDTFNFSENFIKIIQNFKEKEKGQPWSPRPAPKSAYDDDDDDDDTFIKVSKL